MVIGYAACKIHNLAVGGETAGTLFKFRIYLAFNLFGLLPASLLVALGNEHIGTLLPGNATQVLSCGLFACACRYNHCGVFANIHWAHIATLSVEFSRFLYNVTVRVVFPVGRLHCRSVPYLRHTAIGCQRQKSLIVQLCSTVVALLQLCVGKVEYGH